MRTLGFTASLADVEKVCLASLQNRAVTNPAEHAAWSEHDNVIASDDVLLAAMNGGTFAQPWHHHNSCTRIMWALYLQHHTSMGLHLQVSQREVHRLLRAPRDVLHDSALLALRRRATRWDPAVPEALLGAYLHLSSMRPPLEVLFACLRSVCNAWCTTARFGNAPVLCPFGCGCHGGDAQVHLLRCSFFRLWLDLHLYCAALSSATSVAQLIRCLAPPAPRCMRAAMSMDIALWASDRIRHGSKATPCDLFSARLNELALRHLVCRSALP